MFAEALQTFGIILGILAVLAVFFMMASAHGNGSTPFIGQSWDQWQTDNVKSVNDEINAFARERGMRTHTYTQTTHDGDGKGWLKTVTAFHDANCSCGSCHEIPATSDSGSE